MKSENGRVIKGNIKLIEYGDGSSQVDNYFVQVGVAGIYCSKKELNDVVKKNPRHAQAQLYLLKLAKLNHVDNAAYAIETLLRQLDESLLKEAQ